jgi:hypothetical protein
VAVKLALFVAWCFGAYMAFVFYIYPLILLANEVVTLLQEQ